MLYAAAAAACRHVAAAAVVPDAGTTWKMNSDVSLSCPPPPASTHPCWLINTRDEN